MSGLSIDMLEFLFVSTSKQQQQQIGSTFGRETAISDPKYVRAQVVLEDLQYRQKLLRYVVSGTSFSESIRKFLFAARIAGPWYYDRC